MIFSILIASMHSRAETFEPLFKNLCEQANQYDDVEVIALIDSGAANGGVTTGKKRQLSLEMAAGKYVAWIDDDDEVAEDYVSLIREALLSDQDVDCIGTKGTMTTDGAKEKAWSISMHHKGWHENGGVFYRTPNHLSPIRKTIALIAGFPDKTIGEDYEYSKAVLPHLKKEIFIDKNIYHYRFKNRR